MSGSRALQRSLEPLQMALSPSQCLRSYKGIYVPNLFGRKNADLLSVYFPNRAIAHDSAANIRSTAVAKFVNEEAIATIANSQTDEFLQEVLEGIIEEKCMNLEKWEALAFQGHRESSSISVDDICLLLEVCLKKRFLDFNIFHSVTEILCPLVTGADLDRILRVCHLYSELSFLHEPLFTNIAEELLSILNLGTVFDYDQNLQILRAFALQRYRHEALLGSILKHLKEAKEPMTPENAVKFFFWYAQLDKADLSVQIFLLPFIQSHMHALDLDTLSLLMHCLFIANCEQEFVAIIKEAMERMAPLIFSHEIQYWHKNSYTRHLHWRLLLIRSCLRYGFRDVYDSLSALSRSSLKKIRDIEFRPFLPKETKFIKTFSWYLKELRIGYYCHFVRGPFIFDIAERDIRVIWELNSYHRYYVGTLNKTSAAKLQERVAKAMGFVVAECPYWHWSKMKVKRTRFEYIRMSRYYALRDRRKFDAEFEGWTLPYIHAVHPDAKNVHHKNYFPQYKAVSETSF